MQTLSKATPTNDSQATPLTRKPLRVLMVGALPLELSQVKGGVEAVILNLFSGFSQIESVQILHVAFTKDVKKPTSKKISDNVEIVYVPFVVGPEIPDYVINTKEFRSIRSRFQPDIIHIQEITPQILRFLASDKSAFVVTQHGIMREELKYALGLGQKLKCQFKALVEKYIFPLYPNVIFISNYNKRLYTSTPKNGAQIYNPVNPIFFDTGAEPLRRKNKLIYVGVLSPRKNIRVVIEALAQLRKEGKVFDLEVVGGFKDGAYEKEIMSLVESSGLKDQITFHGWKTQAELRAIFEGIPVFILPSQQETLPVSIGEAMALGKIVIASDVGAVNEMFTDRESGFLFQKNDTLDLVRALKELDSHENWAEIGQKARLEAEKKFHPLTIAKQTLDFYGEVIQSNKALREK